MLVSRFWRWSAGSGGIRQDVSPRGDLVAWLPKTQSFFKKSTPHSAYCAVIESKKAWPAGCEVLTCVWRWGVSVGLGVDWDGIWLARRKRLRRG